MTDGIGRQLGNYRLVRLLGRGGFADVYLAEHIHLETLAAVKVLSMRLTSEHVEKFRTEARTIARLVHPHIVRVLDFGVEQDTPYLVMDYAPHGSLHRRHPRGKSLPLSTVVEYVKQIAGALQYAHEKRVIHRDIKPENLLLSENNDVLLSDFGIALVAQSSLNPGTQDIAGTMAYMAPEQIRGKPRRASDQYALGIIVYEWLAGELPFRGSLTEVVGQHLAIAPPSFYEKAPSLPPAVEQVVMTALEKDPEKRFASVQAFAVALEQASQPPQLFAPITTANQPSQLSHSIPSSSLSTPPESAQPPAQRVMSSELVVSLDHPPQVQEMPQAESVAQLGLSTTSSKESLPKMHLDSSIEQPALSPLSPVPPTVLDNMPGLKVEVRSYRSAGRLLKREKPLLRAMNFRAYLLLVISLVLLVSVICWRLLIFAPSSGSSVRTTPLTAVTGSSIPAPQLHIVGNLLVDSHNHVVRLTGANRSGTETECLLSSDVFDGPSTEASIDAMLTWHINAIRIPLNEDCWLGINVKNPHSVGEYYRDQIHSYVQLLISNGITPILELYWSAPGKQTAIGQQPMPDRDHSVQFWQQVAQAYKRNTEVIFDLFSTPFPDNNRDTPLAWQCWLHGTNATYCPARTAGLDYAAAGMQDLVTTVRNTGARNVIMLGGIQYAATLDHWAQYKPVDTLNQLAASWHLYNFSDCNQSSCWYSQGLPLMQKYPLITGEIGENDRQSAFITNVMKFLDNPGDGLRSQSYLAWVWSTDQTKFDLITDYYGKPTSAYGKVYMDHLLALYTVSPTRPTGQTGQ